MKTKIMREKLLSILKECNLNGTIPECVLAIKKGRGSIEAIDITNTLLFSSTTKLGSDKGIKCELGLGNIDILVKFLSSSSDKNVNLKIDDSTMDIRYQGGSRRLKYNLTDATLISSTTDPNDEIFKKIKKLLKFSCEINDKEIKDLLSFITLTQNAQVKIKIEEESINIVCGNEDEHNLSLTLSSVCDSDDNEFSMIVNGELLSKILSVIKYDSDNKPRLLFGEDAPLGIKTKNAFWALTPLSEEE